MQVSVIIPEYGKLSWSAGWADSRQQKAATTSDVYHIGSISKMYTSAVVMKLVQDGIISLDDPLSKYMDDFQGSERITIKNLLNHTSGIYNYTENIGFQLNTILRRKHWDVEEILRIGKEEGLYFEPGSDHYYSNTNYVILGKKYQANLFRHCYKKNSYLL